MTLIRRRFMLLDLAVAVEGVLIFTVWFVDTVRRASRPARP